MRNERLENERAQVEAVFGLTGGELESEPWIVEGWSEGDAESNLIPRPWTFTYWYEGVPEYIGISHGRPRPRLNDPDYEYRTMCRQLLWGEPPQKLAGGWTLAELFWTSGETECFGYGQEVEEGGAPCPLCEEEGGNRHGYVYIGDGWAELVYMRKVEDDG